MTKPRFEAAGKYVIDWHDHALSVEIGDEASAIEVADIYNRRHESGNYIRCLDKMTWSFHARQDPSSVKQTPGKPADCPDHYWAAPYQCIEVRDAIVRSCPKATDSLVIADWCQLFQYVFRVLRKGEPVKDLLKIENFARILRKRLEGRK